MAMGYPGLREETPNTQVLPGMCPSVRRPLSARRCQGRLLAAESQAGRTEPPWAVGASRNTTGGVPGTWEALSVNFHFHFVSSLQTEPQY